MDGNMIRLAFALTLLASSALAQQAPTPQVQALSDRVMQEINTSLACSGNLIAAQQEITKLKAELATLKPEPKKE